MMSPLVHIIMKMRKFFFLKRIFSLIQWKHKIPNTPNQALFQDPYVDFLKTSEEGIKVANNSISTSATKFFRTAVEKQSKWECPCLSYMLKEMSQD